MRRLARAALASALFSCAAPALAQTSYLADLSLKENRQVYDIEGKTAAEIQAGLAKHGLISATESGYRSPFVWQLSWQLTPVTTAEGCKVKDLAVTLTTIASEPDWEAPAAAPAALKAEWARYLGAYRAWMAKHRSITVAKAQALKARVAKLQAQNCEALKRGVDFIGQQWLDDMHKADDDFARTTRHGEADGVTWNAAASKAPQKPAAKPAQKKN